MAITKRKLNEARPAVFARNHRVHLDEAVKLKRSVTFRSRARWASAERARAQHTWIPIYFAAIGSDGLVEFVADLVDLDDNPSTRRKRTRDFLAYSTASTRGEGLSAKVKTLYLIQNCRRVKEPFPFTQLVKISDDEPIAPNYKYSYTVVHQRGTGPAVSELLPGEINDPELFAEGATRQVSVVAHERNRRAREACLRRHGYDCAVCGMNFEKRYGEIGRGFIHVHHKIPISKVGGSYKVNPARDLVPLCPNCHAMVHQPREGMLSIAELRKRIRD